MKNSKELKEVAAVFLKLGLTGFGGPAVHIAMMEEEVVKKRKWMTGEHFLDLVGATNLIPGPNSTEMTMHCGYLRAGWKGLIVAGLCFILPAVIITAVFAYAYQRYEQLPEVEPFLYGIKPAILAVVVALMISLGKKSLKNLELGVIGALAAIFTLAGANEILVLYLAGLAGILLHLLKSGKQKTYNFMPVVLLQVPATVLNWQLFWSFLKIGSILYGSGYALFAFLDAELVTRGLINKQQLTDAIAVGQFTPGPVFSSATFVGWQISGWKGALAATAGIFLPSFLFVAFLHPLIPVLRRSALMSAFLDTVNIVSVAIILAVCVELGKGSITGWKTILIAVAGFVITWRFKKLNTAWIILGGAVSGYLLYPI
ncbi:chromate efflux transporter [Pseudoflavitalea rhizosphaerae]|uniref:chromate efflux transporter n=1 Tax=Pseudoflavitalea rhizosphaerae TaxID=1884793 RepID=UPI000F8DC379|nr:chromate efflux transporter [Pseudoflavitalea rhizosphaerae]